MDFPQGVLALGFFVSAKKVFLFSKKMLFLQKNYNIWISKHSRKTKKNDRQEWNNCTRSLSVS